MFKFMKRIFGKLPHKKHRFKITKDAAEIIRVYKVGPDSCMKGCRSPGSYAKGDLALAYMQNIKTKKIVARAVVWPKKRLWYRAYADNMVNHVRLQRSLAYRGYHHGRLKGARVYLEYGLPSIDGRHGLRHNHRENYVVVE